MFGAGAASGISEGNGPSNGLRCTTTVCDSDRGKGETVGCDAGAVGCSPSPGTAAEDEGARGNAVVEALVASRTDGCMGVADPPFGSAACIGPVGNVLETGGPPLSAATGLGWT